MTPCLFCDIVAGKIPSKKVFEDEDLYVFADIQPQAPTHLLIVPKKHIASLNDLQSGDAELVGKMVLLATHLAESQGVAESGYRVVLNCNRDAGQAVFHIHLHLLGGRPMSWPPG